jgi:hypothetical protein
MSQHHIDTPQYEVIVGWDRLLKYFFGTVFDKAKKDPDHEVVFATLELPEGGVQTVEELATVLQPYLRLPNELLECLEEDRVNNRCRQTLGCAGRAAIATGSQLAIRYAAQETCEIQQLAFVHSQNPERHPGGLFCFLIPDLGSGNRHLFTEGPQQVVKNPD